ncbi:MAG: CusA/CzcA family heavy metal efflux RND transporter [Candidatus Kapabacteria bacterium]|jgi:Cu(I)/Ag(I) efflux system membrane protein CusA/SilA|nr:CusA/CzcA family heavy metal efflux RND transporter [Candidatus Kapabacteria bacterium]
MIERIIDWSARNRFIVLLAYLIVTGFGVYATLKLPVDALPDLSENQVIVFTEWMGRSPQIIEDQITYPLTTALQGLAGVKAVRGSSMFGMSFVFVIFDDDTDLYFARNRVAERLSILQAQLPKGAVPTLGPDGTGVGHIFWYTVQNQANTLSPSPKQQPSTHEQPTTNNQKLTTNNQPTTKLDLAELRAVQDWYIRYKLAAVEGVAEVASIGGFVRQYQVDVDPMRLRAYNVTMNEVVSAIQRNNNEVGGKLVEVSGAEYFVRGQGYIRSRADLDNALIRTGNGGTPIPLKNVATVQLGAEIRRGALDQNGEGEAVGGIVVMRSGANAREVIQRVKEKITQISPGLPAGVEIRASYDRSTLIDEAVGTLERALLEAALVVAVVVALFLLHFRSIVRIIIEIPISVLLAFMFMYAFGITSNIMSLGGIILAIGVIVDSSIVLVENAYRNLANATARAASEGITLTSDDFKRISIDSAKQVGRAIFFSELIILVSFLPVFLLTGQEGKLFHPLAYTKTFTMLGSAIVVLTLIPVLMTLLMHGKFRPEDANHLTRLFKWMYAPLIRAALQYRKTALGLNLLALALAVPMALSVGSEFMPPLDEGSILFMPVTLPNASLPEVNRILQTQDRVIRTVPEVEHVLGKLGRAETATDNAPVSMIETIILLKPRHLWREGITKKDIIAELDKKLQIPGVRNGWTQPIVNRINMLSTGVRTDIGLKIYGKNLDTLEHLAIRAEEILQSVEGAADIAAERGQRGAYLDISVKTEAAARYGMTIGDIQDIVETAIGGQNLGVIIEGRMRFPVRARYASEFRSHPDDLKRLLIPVNFSPNAAQASMQAPAQNFSQNVSQGSSQNASNGETSGMGSMQASSQGSSNQGSANQSSFAPANLFSDGNASGRVFMPLSALADITITHAPAMIASENGNLRSVVFLNARGRDMGSVVEDAKRVIEQDLALPAGYSMEWSGQYEHKVRAQRTIALIMPIVFLVIFVLLYFTLKDYKEAGVVMLSVPFALIGGVYTVYALGYNFSVAVWVGFIALYGVATETGVVMVVYLHEALDKRLRAFQRGERGEITNADIHDAALEGSILRLRPKLMTVLTAMISLIPVMWSSGTGADVMKPLTAPMIGGLLTSAVHVLIITPVLFVMMKERALKRGSLTVSSMAEWMHE